MNAYSKVNTFTRTPCIQQMICYAASILEVSIFFSLIQPHFSHLSTRLTLIIVYSISLLAKIVSSVYISYSDPSDELMMLSKAPEGPHKQAGIAKMKEQLNHEYLYCKQCFSFVKMSSKHCRKCNRCVQNFDHHCMWVNNCIGHKNYQPFIAMLYCVEIEMSVFIAAAAILTSERHWLTSHQEQSMNLGEMVGIWITLAIVCIFWFLNFNLIVLHMFLISRGITTYEWIFGKTDNTNPLYPVDSNKLKSEAKSNNKVFPISYDSMESDYKTQMKVTKQIKLTNEEEEFRKDTADVFEKEEQDSNYHIHNFGFSPHQKEASSHQISSNQLYSRSNSSNIRRELHSKQTDSRDQIKLNNSVQNAPQNYELEFIPDFGGFEERQKRRSVPRSQNSQVPLRKKPKKEPSLSQNVINPKVPPVPHLQRKPSLPTTFQKISKMHKKSFEKLFTSLDVIHPKEEQKYSQSDSNTSNMIEELPREE